MSITTYAQLKQKIADLIEDDSVEVSAYIPTAIQLAEEKCAKDLDLQRFQLTTTVSTHINVSIPGGGIDTVVSTGISDNGFLNFAHVFQCGTKLDKVDYSATKEINRWESSAGVSGTFWSYKNTAGVIYIAPPVSVGSGVYEIVYNARPTKLSNLNTTNIILQKAPELLLYAALIDMSTFLKNWETVGQWEKMYQSSLETNLNATRKERQDVGQKHMSNSNQVQSTTGIQ